MNQNVYDLDNSTELGYGEIFSIFWRRRSYFIGICGGVLACMIPLVLTQKPVYRSSMQMLVEPNYEDKDNRGDFDPIESSIEIDYATQLNLMRSSQLLGRAVVKLRPSYPDITTEEIQNYLVVSQVREQEDKKEVGTKIFQAVYKDEDAEKTQRVLEAIQEVYLEYNLEQQDKRLREGLSFINQEIPEVRQKLTNAERNLEVMLTRYNLIAPQTEAIDISKLLTNTRQQREELKAQYKQTQSKYESLEQQLATTGNVDSVDSRLSLSSRYQNLLNELQRIDIELETQRSRFTDSNPIVQGLLTERRQKQQLLEKEAGNILGSTNLQVSSSDNLESRGQLDSSNLELAEALASTRNELIGLESRERSLALTEQKLKEKLNQFPDLIAQYNSLEQEVAVHQATLKKLLESRQEIGIVINRGGFSWEIIEPPQQGLQISPNITQDLVLGGIVSVFLGAVSVVIMEASDNKIRVSRQLQEKVNFPLLGTTPGLSKIKDSQFSVRLPFFSGNDQETIPLQVIEWLPFRESLDLVYENIQLMSQNSLINSIAITSSIAGEGKSTITLGLALSAARRRKKVLVIDGDLRCPTLHEKLDISNGVGLSDLLDGVTSVPTVQEISRAGSTISVLTSGSATSDPVKLLSSGRLQNLIAHFEKTYDLVLIDTPPAIGMVDAIKIASSCSGTVVVARLEKANFAELMETYGLLGRINVLGMVANDSREVQQRYAKNKRYLPSAEV
ncbi:GumC family protein [Hyella patelloides]|nr:polysaccharide biosynthesis tyrosine autokinase [Hyella patelloides]